MTPQELKNSILQLAIQGKLVEQRPEEGTAEELFQKIQEEKQRLIAEKKIKKRKPLPEITDDEKPFDIPESWKWVRIGDFSLLVTKGTTPRGGNVSYSEGGIGFLRAENVAGLDKLDKTNIRYIDENTHVSYLKRSVLQENDILITIAGTLGRTAIVKKEDLPLNANQAVSIVRLVNNYCIELMYLIFALNSRDVQKYLAGQRKTTAIPNLTLEIIEKCIIPLPPLAEQKRIVAKIEELLPYIERYEKAWNKLEQFNKRFPEDMKKSLLQYAIEGKLVEQRPEEGTAEELFQKIQEEKQRLIHEKKIKKEKPLPEITDDEKPFDIPESWKWVRLQQIGELSRGRSQKRPRNDPKLFINGTFPFIQTGDVARANCHISCWTTMYNQEGVAQSRIWPSGTVCLTIAANIGDVAILDFDSCFPDSVVGFNAYKPIMSNEFFMYGLMCYKTILDKLSRSTAQKNINIEILSQIAFPLPPLAEQKRIVEKLEQLLTLCDRLK